MFITKWTQSHVSYLGVRTRDLICSSIGPALSAGPLPTRTVLIEEVQRMNGGAGCNWRLIGYRDTKARPLATWQAPRAKLMFQKERPGVVGVVSLLFQIVLSPIFTHFRAHGRLDWGELCTYAFSRTGPMLQIYHNLDRNPYSHTTPLWLTTITCLPYPINLFVQLPPFQQFALCLCHIVLQYNHMKNNVSHQTIISFTLVSHWPVMQRDTTGQGQPLRPGAT